MKNQYSYRVSVFEFHPIIFEFFLLILLQFFEVELDLLAFEKLIKLEIIHGRVEEELEVVFFHSVGGKPGSLFGECVGGMEN